MKRIFVLYICLSIFYTSNAQVRIGRTIDEIKKEFSQYECRSEVSDEGIIHLYIKMDNLDVTYFFNNDKEKSNHASVQPLTQGCLNGLIESYNKEYVVISPTEWRMYSLNGSTTYIYLITLMNPVFFLFVPEPQKLEYLYSE